MRKIMSKEVTTTTLKLGKIKLVDGTPIVEQLPDEIIIGTPNDRNISRLVYRKHGAGVTIYSKEIQKLVYEMEVEEFIKYAKLKGKEEPEETADQQEQQTTNQQTENTGSTIIVRQKRG